MEGLRIHLLYLFHGSTCFLLISDIQTGEEECCHSSELLLSLESQKLSFYCKIIKNELVTAGVVEEEKVGIVRWDYGVVCFFYDTVSL